VFRESRHTNERLYESKDSLEMLNGSSLSIARWLVVVLVELLDLVDQKFLRSVGEGWLGASAVEEGIREGDRIQEDIHRCH
jgi:hypothetical protein